MPSPTISTPCALTIAGSDCSSGAGIQADLKAMTHFRVYGLTAVTCVVAEVPDKVSRIAPVDAATCAEQIALLCAAFPIKAVKTGMLYSREIIRLTAATFAAMPLKQRPPLIVDPVMIATSGHSLLKKNAIRSYEDELFPLATLITPNMDEAAFLLGKKTLKHDTETLDAAAIALHERYGCAVLLKGGHLTSGDCVDILRSHAGYAAFSAPRIPRVSTHGTGCTLSAAIAARMAHGDTLPQAVSAGKKYVTAAIANSLRWRHGRTQVQALRHW